MLTSYKLEDNLFQKCLTPWKTQIVLGLGNIFLIKIKIKCPAGQNLEIMTFRYLKTLVFDSFYKKLRYLMFLFLNVLMLVLLVITTPPSSLWFFDFFPSYTLISHSFQENWHGYKKFWRSIVQGGWCYDY